MHRNAETAEAVCSASCHLLKLPYVVKVEGGDSRSVRSREQKCAPAKVRSRDPMAGACHRRNGDPRLLLSPTFEVKVAGLGAGWHRRDSEGNDLGGLGPALGTQGT